MSKFWPVVFWFAEKNGDNLIYKPSRYHANQAQSRYSFDNYWMAHKHARKRIVDSNHDADSINALPSFLPWVIEQDNEPDMTASSTLRLLVERIPLNEGN